VSETRQVLLWHLVQTLMMSSDTILQRGLPQFLNVQRNSSSQRRRLPDCLTSARHLSSNFSRNPAPTVHTVNDPACVPRYSYWSSRYSPL